MAIIVAILVFTIISFANAGVVVDPAAGNAGAGLTNIWNYKVDRKVTTAVKYKGRVLAVWEQEDGATATSSSSSNSATRRIFYVTPPIMLVPESAVCRHLEYLGTYQVEYEIQLWSRELPRAVVEGLKRLSISVSEEQILPLPFYQAKIIWNNPDVPLRGLKLSTAWINNLQQHSAYRFRVHADNNASCESLQRAIRSNPGQFADNLQFQFTLSAAKVDSKIVTVQSKHVAGSRLLAALRSMPDADGAVRYLRSSDYNRMLWQIVNQVVASEVTSSDYVEADDKISLKESIGQMFRAQTENTAHFDDRMWRSTFWDPLNQRPDRITSELNKLLVINKTDSRVYRKSSSESDADVGFSFLGLINISAGESESSSLTTDDINNNLAIHGVESEVKGDKFVPKRLNLTRLNLNDISRQDVLVTKRIQVRQAEIGGTFQIGVADSSADAAEEENQFLRRQVNDLQTKIAILNGNITDGGVIQSLPCSGC